tara:strand:- start:259 stop:561 length:303 start_codon:yes stop_codon:yes gene_type:complete
MKITKKQLKQLIKEEVGSDNELLKAIEKLSKNIGNLDVSIDYLAAAFTGESAISVGTKQATLGRAAHVKKPVAVATREAQALELKDIIREELEEVLRLLG